MPVLRRTRLCVIPLAIFSLGGCGNDPSASSTEEAGALRYSDCATRLGFDPGGAQLVLDADRMPIAVKTGREVPADIHSACGRLVDLAAEQTRTSWGEVDATSTIEAWATNTYAACVWDAGFVGDGFQAVFLPGDKTPSLMKTAEEVPTHLHTPCMTLIAGRPVAATTSWGNR